MINVFYYTEALLVTTNVIQMHSKNH